MDSTTDHGQARPRSVAVVGSGLAGLTTAYLLQNDALRRYSVTIFEAHDAISLDAASVSLHDAQKGRKDRIDVPMRAFAGGFYHNLKRMYDFLGIPYHAQRFLFSFVDAAQPHPPRPYFVHASNNHSLPPLRPRGVSVVQYLLQVLFIMLAYAYWTLVVFALPPRNHESLAAYLRRTHVPARFTSDYLLPLMSSVSTCSHADMLAFPASDIVTYKRSTQGQPHYAVSNGVRHVSERLSRGIQIHFSSWVTHVAPTAGAVRLSWEQRGNYQGVTKRAQTFDHVVLAVAPPVVASVFPPLRERLGRVPFTLVDTLVARDAIAKSVIEHEASYLDSSAAQLIRFRSRGGQTVSTHIQSSGALVQTRVADDPSSEADFEDVVKVARFPRVLRTPESQRLVNEIFACGPVEPEQDEKKRLNSGWRNGDGNVWLAGGWCWDGMVLLEGCVVSAMRVAKALDVDVPWER